MDYLAKFFCTLIFKYIMFICYLLVHLLGKGIVYLFSICWTFQSDYKHRPLNNLETASVDKIQYFVHPSDVGILCFKIHDFPSGSVLFDIDVSLKYAISLNDITHLLRLETGNKYLTP